MSWLTFFNDNSNIEQNNYTISLLKGRNLPITQGDNIYCKLKIGSLKIVTSTVLVATSKEITWNETFSCFLSDTLLLSELQIKCYKKGFLSDTLVGKCYVSLNDNKYVQFSHATCNWFVLKDKTRKNSGEVQVKLGQQIRSETTLGPIVTREKISDDNKSAEELNKSAEELYKEAAECALDANKSAIRSLALLTSMNEINIETYQALKRQENQIDNMRSDVDTLHDTINQSNRKLRSIESGFGSLANKITSSKVRTKKGKKHHTTKTKQQGCEQYFTPSMNNNITLSSAPVMPSSNCADYEFLFHETINSTNTIIDKLNIGLDNTKEIAIQLGVHLNVDAEKLADLQYNVSKESGRLDNTIKRSRALVR
jgi:hypothetical protein